MAELRVASRGRVVAVHRRAATLQLDGGALVAVICGELPLHPWALQLAAGQWEDGAPHLREGADVGIASRALTCGDWQLPMTCTEVVDLSIANRPLRMTGDIAHRLWEAAAARFSDGPFDPMLRQALQRWIAGSRASELASLVGRGEGLTPSGDDVIVGALAGLDFCGRALVLANQDRMDLCGALPKPLENHTTRLAAQMIVAAVDAQYVESLPALAAQLAASGADWRRVEAAADRLLTLGHCSGRDLLAGFAATLARKHKG